MFIFHSYLLASTFGNFFNPISSRHKYKTRLASKSTFSIPLMRTNLMVNFIFALRVGAILSNNVDESV